MANFHTKTFLKNDDYMTPKYVWEDIKDYIPKDKIIWEAFYGDGQSGKDLKDLGFNVIHEEIDFFKNNKGDIIVSNPPFSKSKEILLRLKKLEKPFILILPSSKINTNYFRNLFLDSRGKLQIIIPKKRINFLKKSNKRSQCNFDCFYYCYKINLEKDITWLN